MGIFYFPCNFVYWRQITKHQIYKSKIIDMIENNKDMFVHHKLIANGSSSYVFKDKNRELMDNIKDLIQDVVWNTVDESVKILNYRNNTPKISINESFIESMWVSIYNENATVATHEHYGGSSVVVNNNKLYTPSFTLVYIVKDPNERNTTVFVEPYMMSKSVYGMEEQLLDTSLENDIGEGTVLIFPSSLHHRVDMMKKTGRIIMSFNIASK